MNNLKLIFATHNLNKFNEINKMIPEGIKVQSLSDLKFAFEIPENENTIEKNAIFKAKFIYSKFNSTVFADDTGLEVDSLNGKPGVHSARYAGIERDSIKNNEKLLSELSGIKNRKANFKTIISLVHDGKVYLFEGKIVGKIALSQKGSFGFGYDSIFIPNGYKKTFGQLDPNLKNSISHRSIAFKKLMSFLKKISALKN